MKKVVLRLVILFCIFVGCVIGFSAQQNSEVTVRATGMSGPTLPVLYMQVAGHTCNRMVGHARPIDEATERSSLTPLPTDRALTVQMQDFGTDIDSVSYQVTDLSDGAVSENGRISGFAESDGLKTAGFSLERPILAGQEYMLRFCLEIEGRDPVYYYTRLVQSGGISAEPYLDFAVAFYESCLSTTSEVDITAWLETTDEGAEESLDHLDIHAGESQVHWDTLLPSIERRGIPAICEINATTASVAIDYAIRATDGDISELYEVRDFYRMRKGQSEVALLNFERTTCRIPDGTGMQTDTGLNLGLQSRDLAWMADRDLSTVAFVAGRELWAYDRAANRLTEIFSFRTQGGTDARAEDRNHDIRILRVEESGDILFALYGTQVSGVHEGEDGLAILRYHADNGFVEETVFLALGQSFPFLERSLSQLIYANAEGELFLLLGEQLCRIDLESAGMEILVDNLDSDLLLVSESQRMIAWPDPADNKTAPRWHLLDLEMGRSGEVTAGSGEQVLGIGFFDEDFVCGFAKESNIVRGGAGSETIGLDRIRIQDIDGSLKKEYSKEGKLVTAAVWDGSSLALELSTRTDTGFRVSGEDHIVNNLQRDEDIYLLAREDARTGSHLEFIFSGEEIRSELAVGEAVFQVPEGETLVPEVTWSRAGGSFCAYGVGRLRAVGQTAGEVLQVAEETAGVMLDEKQRVLWERGNWPASAMVNTENLPSCVRSAELSESVLQQELGSDTRVLNLTGCQPESLNYFLSKGRPVIAKTGGNEGVLLVGYDGFNFWMYQGEGRDAKAIATDDAQALFAANGNVFLSYMEE